MPVTLDYERWISPKASRNVRSLRPVLDKLKTVHEDLINNGEDTPYWYGERSHIGLFAAAVWLCGGTALEEYGCRKLKKAEDTAGRSDLWIGLNQYSIECEAKCVRLNLGKSIDFLVSQVGNGLSDAIEDLKCHQDKKGLAICFVTMRIHKSKISSMDKKRRDLMLAVNRQLPCHATAWIGVCKETCEMWDTKKALQYPGVLLVIVEGR